MLKKLSFALFDSGETILGALIFSTLFPLYITKYVDPKIYSVVYGLAFFISFLFALFLGKLADEKGLRKTFYVLFVGLTSAMSVFLWLVYENPFYSLLFFVLMTIFHQQAFVFYNSLLLDFERRGFVSGLGVAFGYVGSAVALIFLAKYLQLPNAYIVVGFIFFVLALPSFFFLENPTQKAKVSLKEVFKDKGFLVLIISILSLTEVANTVVAMMGIYLKEVYSLNQLDIYKTIGFSAVGGIFGGIFWGKLVDIFSVRKIFPFGFVLWICFVLILPFVPKSLVVFAGFLAGISLAHLWTTSRVFVIDLFPDSQVSVRLSFLSLTERVASTTGLLVWSFFLYVTDNNFRVSAFLMVGFPIIGAFVFFVFFRRFIQKA
ncbi:MAG: MFS transporter [Aquificae bacterium]|nr:MFS transporter [Aquificota bacterium]